MISFHWFTRFYLSQAKISHNIDQQYHLISLLTVLISLQVLFDPFVDRNKIPVASNLLPDNKYPIEDISYLGKCYYSIPIHSCNHMRRFGCISTNLCTHKLMVYERISFTDSVFSNSFPTWFSSFTISAMIYIMKNKPNGIFIFKRIGD